MLRSRPPPPPSLHLDAHRNPSFSQPRPLTRLFTRNEVGSVTELSRSAESLDKLSSSSSGRPPVNFYTPTVPTRLSLIAASGVDVCNYCKKPLGESLSSRREVNSKLYHALCVRCFRCDVPLSEETASCFISQLNDINVFFYCSSHVPKESTNRPLKTVSEKKRRINGKASKNLEHSQTKKNICK
jgi:hypothetical protein